MGRSGHLDLPQGGAFLNTARSDNDFVGEAAGACSLGPRQPTPATTSRRPRPVEGNGGAHPLAVGHADVTMPTLLRREPTSELSPGRTRKAPRFYRVCRIFEYILGLYVYCGRLWWPVLTGSRCRCGG